MQAVLSMRIAHSTPLSQVSSTTCSSPDISPIFRKPLVRNIKLYVPSNLQIPHQQAPTSREVFSRTIFILFLLQRLRLSDATGILFHIRNNTCPISLQRGRIRKYIFICNNRYIFVCLDTTALR